MPRALWLVQLPVMIIVLQLFGLYNSKFCIILNLPFTEPEAVLSHLALPNQLFKARRYLSQLQN